MKFLGHLTVAAGLLFPAAPAEMVGVELARWTRVIAEAKIRRD
jgi:hypothetical protein